MRHYLRVMRRSSIFCKSQSTRGRREAHTPPELALTAPPPFSRRQFLATSTTASMAFTLASQPGRLSAQAPTTERSGRNPRNTGQPWTIKLPASGKAAGANDRAESLEFKGKQAAGTRPSGKPCLLVVSWCLTPGCFIPGITENRDRRRSNAELLAQVRVDPGPKQNLPQGYADSMTHDDELYRTVLLNAGGAENGNIDVKIDKDTTPMTCGPTLANDGGVSGKYDIDGKRMVGNPNHNCP